MSDHRMEEVEFTGVYNRYFSVVLQYIRNQHGMPHPGAEDIAQDIFLILWRRREKLVDFTPLENYLFIMVKNRLVNEARRAACRRRMWRELGAESGEAGGVCYQEVDGGRAERWLGEAVELLPAQVRAAYVLREGCGLKVREVAGVMNISQAGASRRLREAAENIRLFVTRQLL